MEHYEPEAFSEEYQEFQDACNDAQALFDWIIKAIVEEKHTVQNTEVFDELRREMLDYERYIDSISE